MSKKWFGAAKSFISVTQLSISLLGPIIFFILISTFLREKFQLGNWVVATGVLLGFGAGICAFINYLKLILKDFEKKGK